MHHRTLCGGLAVVLGGLVLVWPLATGADTIDLKSVNLTTVLSRVLERNPGLDEYPYRFRAADAAVVQAGIRPSTEVSWKWKISPAPGNGPAPTVRKSRWL